MTKPDWNVDLAAAVKLAKTGASSDLYVDANVATAMQVARGLGPDASATATPHAGAGLRIVFNIACKHVEGFCRSSGNAYQNAYTLKTVNTKRQAVDLAVAEAAKHCGVTLAPKDIYFGAVETSGSGVRFYGDMCFVLKERPAFSADVPAGAAPAPGAPLLVLDRNSYDVIRAPTTAAIQAAVGTGGLSAAQANHMLTWMGSWEEDLLALSASRVFEQLPRTARRWTTGQIAQALLSDEDYIEVLYPNSFDAGDLLEVRLAAADVAAEAEIATREAAGESPLPEECLWRDQRREARRALARMSVPVRVVLTAGRIKAS